MVRVHVCPREFYSGVEQLAARQAHNLEVAGSNPAPATRIRLRNLGLGSSMVERSPEEAGVVSSILTRGTRRQFYIRGVVYR